MKNINKILAIALSITTIAGLTACSKNNDAPAQTAATNMTAAPVVTAAPITTPPITETSIETTVETEPPEDLTSIPETSELITSIAEQLNTATSFEISCNLKGCIPEPNSAIGKMIEHEFTYTISGNNSHLKSTTDDLDVDDSTTEYEEYQKLDDNIITTITKFGDNWVDNTPKEMIRHDMSTKALYSIGLVEIIASNGETTDDIFANATVERDDVGNYIITLPDWYTWTCEDEDFLAHGFSGLLRAPHLSDRLYNLSILDPEGNITYTVDKNFNLTNMSFDIIMPQAGSYDLICEIEFSDWNEIANINVPRPMKPVEETSVISEETSEIESETT